MWPFGGARAQKHLAAALAANAPLADREQALQAIMALPQKSEWLESYRRIAFDADAPTSLRTRAIEAIGKSSSDTAARLLLDCLGGSLYRPALFQLVENPRLWGHAKASPDLPPLLRDVLHRVRRAAEANFSERALEDVNRLRRLLNELPHATAIAAEADAAAGRLRAMSVPGLLRRALTEKQFETIKSVLRELERMNLPEAEAALEEFRRQPSRLVEKITAPGVGARDENFRRQVYTSELGQTPCDAEQLQLEGRRRRFDPRRPVAAPPPPLPDPDSTPESQDYVAASARGIDSNLVNLVAHQLPLLQALHRHDSLAPVGATMNGEQLIEGVALTTTAAGEATTVVEALEILRQKFKDDAQAGRIVASALCFHGCHGPGRGSSEVVPAEDAASADCLVFRLENAAGQAVMAVVQYSRDDDGPWRYSPPYFVLRRPLTFAASLRLPARRAAQGHDRDVHPEMMTLWETQLPRIRELLAEGPFAPRAVSLQPSGEIVLRDLPVDAADAASGEALAFLTDQLRGAAEAGQIVASALFFTANYDAARAVDGLSPALPGATADCLVAQLEHRLSQAKSIIVRLRRSDAAAVEFEAPEVHSIHPTIFTGP